MRDNLKRERPELPVGDSHQTQLELTARLFDCAQRRYISDAEWDLMKDPTEELIGMLPSADEIEDYLRIPQFNETCHANVCRNDVVAQSPFATHILLPLASVATSANLVAQQPASAAAAEHVDHSPTGSQESSQLNTTAFGDIAPFLEALYLRSKDLRQKDSRVLVPILQIVGASAEVFPLGSCWTSSCQQNWHNLPADPDLSPSPLPVLAGSPNDLAVLVHLVSQTLTVHGSSNGDPDVQRWGLLALIMLTEATDAQSYLLERDCNALRTLSTIWRNVWKLIFRSDLRYRAYTNDAKVGSHGELVILLLKSMVHRFCTDLEMRWTNSIQHRQSSFLRLNQAEIWNLPLFETPHGQEGPCCFDLITAALFTVGLSEAGSDSICRNIQGAGIEFSNDQEDRRRYKLLEFCMRVLAEGMPREHAENLSACLACLVHGAPPSSSAKLRAVSASNVSFILSRGGKNHNIVSTRIKQGFETPKRIPDSTCPMNCLWDQPLCQDETRRTLCIYDEVCIDAARIVAVTLEKNIHLKTFSLENADFMSISASSSLLERFTSRFCLAFKSWLHRFQGATSSDPTGDASESEAPLPLQLLKMRIKICVVLWTTSGKPGSMLRDLNPSLSHVFHSAALLIKRCPNDDRLLIDSATQIKQIVRALIEATADPSLDLPTEVIEAAQSLSSSIKSLFQLRSKSWRDDVSAKPQSKAPVVDLLMDEENSDDSKSFVHPAIRQLDEDSDDEFESVVGKRKRLGSPSKRKRCKEDGETREMLSQPCAFALASLLVALDPSFEVCESIAKSLIGVREIIKGDIIYADVDTLGGIYACQMICNEATIIHKESLAKARPARTGIFTDSSVTYLIARLIQAVRGSLGIDSVIYPFGFLFCKVLVQLTGSDLHGLTITEEEAALITELLKGSADIDRRSLWHRPFMRALQLFATTRSFVSGKEAIHARIDKDFPRIFVLPSICDLDGRIRRLATEAIAAALGVLPEKRVVDSVKKRLPPLNPLQTAAGGREEYRRWYLEKQPITGVVEVSSSNENRAWDDAFESMQFSTLYCWSTIARVASDSSSLLCFLFDVIQLSSARPDVEKLCFRLVDNVALTLGYNGAEAMLNSKQERLVCRWINSGENSLLALPLLLTAPGMLRRLERLGHYQTIDREGSRRMLLDTDRVVTAAASEFIARCRCFILPLILSRSLTSMLADSVTKEGRRRLFEDIYMKELCCVFFDRYDDESAKKLIKKQVPEIISLQFTLGLNGADQPMANEIERLLNALFSAESVQGLAERGSNQAARRILKLAAQWDYDNGTDHSTARGFAESLQRLIEHVGKPKSQGNFLFSRIGGSTTEALVYAKLLLCQDPVESELGYRYTAMEVVCSLIEEGIDDYEHEHLQVGFCIHVLSSLLSCSRLNSIYPKILQSLESLLSKVLQQRKVSDAFSSELRGAIKDLIGVCMQVHEKYQESLVLASVQMRLSADRWFNRGLGLLHRNKHAIGHSADAWGWQISSQQRGFTADAIAAYRHLVNRNTIATIKGTRGLLRLILENHQVLRLTSGDFVGATPTFSVPVTWFESLADVDPNLSAQVIIQEYLASQGSLKPSKDALTNIISGHVHSGHMGPSVINERILTADLKQLEMGLRSSRLNGAEPVFSHSAVHGLVRDLAFCCGTQFDQTVRVAASRCLGEIDPASVEAEGYTNHHSNSESTLENAITQGRLQDAIRARCAECLLRAIGGSDMKLAMIAIDTIKGLLVACDDVGWREYVSGHENRLLLDSIASGGITWLKRDIYLSESEARRLRNRASYLYGEIPEKDGDGWCWDTKLWNRATAGNGTNFTDWICCIVPALLSCNYGRPVKCNPLDQSIFFVLCQRVSCIEPSFAVTMFPAVVLDLLQNDLGTIADYSEVCVKRDTWIGGGESTMNARISRCISHLITIDGSVDSRAVELAVEVLDNFRRLTQSRFLASKQHSRNLNKLSQTTAEKLAVAENSGKPVKVTWNGVPYGVVLRLDGLLVVKACIFAGRFASAVFYAEMSADALLSGSSSILERLERQDAKKVYAASADLSGYGSSGGTAQPSSFQEHLFELLRAFRKGFHELGEESTGQALSKQMTDLAMSENDFKTKIDRTENQSPSLEWLRLLDSATHQPGHLTENLVSMASVFLGLGLSTVLQIFIQGLRGIQVEQFSQSDVNTLRDQWFECSLFKIGWSDVAKDLDRWDMGRTVTDTGLGGGRVGFHERLCNAIRLFEKDDMEQCLVQLGEARNIIIEEIPVVIHQESPLKKVWVTVDRLRALNDWESYLKAANSRDALQAYDIVVADDQICQMQLSVADMTFQPDSHGEFSRKLEETLMWTFYRKATLCGDVAVGNAILHRLSNLLWRMSADGEDSSTVALERLHYLFSLSSSSIGDQEKIFLKLRLQEARVLEARGDFPGAVRLAKIVISSLRQDDESNERDTMLADALVACGNWLFKHKAEPASTILESYLKPGSSVALSAFEKSGRESPHRATAALLSVGRLAANLFEAVSSRVKSVEWLKSGMNLEERQDELRLCEGMLREAQAQAAKVKGKSKEQPQKAYHEIFFYHVNLSREVSQARGQREKVLSSVATYRSLAIRSIVKALSIADNSGIHDLSKHVYQMVTLWFGSDSVSAWSSVADVIEEATVVVPTFRFVPLCNQLCSRLGSRNGTNSSFQKCLQNLVLKMTREHPYHCLIHIMSLANGTNVGAGVSGRNAESFLENADNSKVEAAKSLLNTLKSENGDLLAGLIESYQALSAA